MLYVSEVFSQTGFGPKVRDSWRMGIGQGHLTNGAYQVRVAASLPNHGIGGHHIHFAGRRHAHVLLEDSKHQREHF